MGKPTMIRPSLARERLIALFVLGVLLLMPPFLGIFNRPLRVFGLPLLYVYLFGAWAGLIALVALVVERGDLEGEDGEARESAGEPDAGQRPEA